MMDDSKEADAESPIGAYSIEDFARLAFDRPQHGILRNLCRPIGRPQVSLPNTRHDRGRQGVALQLAETLPAAAAA